MNGNALNDGLNNLLNDLMKPEDAVDEAAAGDHTETPAAGGSTVLLVMTGPASRRISPPMTAGDYLFRPGEPAVVLAEDVGILVGHEGLAARGVTFAVAPDGTLAPKGRKAGRGCCGGRKKARG